MVEMYSKVAKWDLFQMDFELTLQYAYKSNLEFNISSKILISKNIIICILYK